MSKITCPHCHREFDIEDSLMDSVNQKLIDKEVEKRKQEIQSSFDAKLEAEKANLIRKNQDDNFKLKEKLQELEAQKAKFSYEKQQAVDTAIKEKDTKITELTEQLKYVKNEVAANNKLELQEKESKINELSLKLTALEESKDKEILTLTNSFKMQLSQKDDEIKSIKEFRNNKTTKLIGEELEQYCYNEFYKYRSISNTNMSFDKDNIVSEKNTKGDFIYRESNDENVEILSIMFEMKNESDLSTTHKKNEDFLKKLDEDRKSKNCEYAVLVSTLEPNNELYENGIVDLSYKYPKMYFVRPQYFITIISLLRSAALTQIQVKNELEKLRSQNFDIAQFEKELLSYKNDVSVNAKNFNANFDKAINEIDNSIKALEKTKNNLIQAQKNLSIFERKTDSLTMKKLTKNSPSLQNRLKEYN